MGDVVHSGSNADLSVWSVPLAPQLRRHSSKTLSAELSRDRERLLAEAQAAHAVAEQRLSALQSEAEAARKKFAATNESSTRLVDDMVAQRDKVIKEAEAEAVAAAAEVARLQQDVAAITIQTQVQSRCLLPSYASCFRLVGIGTTAVIYVLLSLCPDGNGSCHRLRVVVIVSGWKGLLRRSWEQLRQWRACGICLRRLSLNSRLECFAMTCCAGAPPLQQDVVCRAVQGSRAATGGSPGRARCRGAATGDAAGGGGRSAQAVC